CHLTRKGLLRSATTRERAMANLKNNFLDNRAGGLPEGAGYPVCAGRGAVLARVRRRAGGPRSCDDGSPAAWLSKDGRTVHKRRGSWEGSFPVDALEGWLAFYPAAAGSKRRQVAVHYAPAVREVERIKE